jgi:hypothetical protein
MEAQEVEVRQHNAIQRVVEETGLIGNIASRLMEAFSPAWMEASAVIAESSMIQVTDATQVTEIKAARSARLKLAKIRKAADHLREDLKEESLRTGQGIQKVYKAVESLIEPEETRLQEIEDFAQRQEDARKAKLVSERTEQLRPFMVPEILVSIDLKNMSPGAFDQLFLRSKVSYEAEVAAKAKAEADRIAKEAADKAEAERVVAENARLKAENEAKDRAAQIERDKAAKELAAAQAKAKAEKAAIEAKAREQQRKADAEAQTARELAADLLRKEQVARAKLEAAAKAKADAEAKRIAAEKAAARKAAMAPDADKIRSLAVMVREIPMPACASIEARNLVGKIRNELAMLAGRIEVAAAQME